MLERIRSRFVATFRPPLTDRATKRAVDWQTREDRREAESLVQTIQLHRERNHIAQRIAAAYDLEPRWK